MPPDSGVAVHQNNAAGQQNGPAGSVGNPPSQYATIHIATKTASMAGASIGPAHQRQQRSSSEGTVVVANRQQAAMSTAAAQPADAHGVNIHMDANEHMDSLSAASKAFDDAGRLERKASKDEFDKGVCMSPVNGGHVDGEGEKSLVEKPTESLSSAAISVQPEQYAAVIATAASLVSQNTGGRGAILEERLDAVFPKSPSGEIPNDNDALNTALAAAASNHYVSSSNQQITVKSHTNTILKHSKLTQMTAPVPGNSSSSGNHARDDGEGSAKRKRRKQSNRPMRPPPAHFSQVRGVNIPQHVAFPTGSSVGGGIHVQVDIGQAADDAVSTVQQPNELLGEVACDAVSKASGEDQDGFTESRLLPNDDVLSAQEENSIRITRSSRKMEHSDKI